MNKKELMVFVDYQKESFSLEEICDICYISPDFIAVLLEHELIQTVPGAAEKNFDISQLLRIKTILRLQRDLEINLEGIATILDLLDELDRWRAKAKLYEKHFLR